MPANSGAQGGQWTKAGQPPQPLINAPRVVLLLIGSMIAVHLALEMAGTSVSTWAYYAFAMIPARFAGGPYPMITGAQYWSLLTHAFLHASWLHLMFNCLWLLVFGTPVARFMGNTRFLGVAAIAALAGGLASLALHWGERVMLVGASGAVSGLLGAAIPIMFGQRGANGIRPLKPIGLVLERRALIFMLVFLGLTLISGAEGLVATSFGGGNTMAWEAHLGGFAGGLAAFYLLLPSRVRRP
jgi:membrane associated rhomboid family serine protease